MTRNVVAFLACSHDIGKANRFFQAKDPVQQKRLRDLGVEEGKERYRHGQATGALLFAWLKEVWGWEAQRARSVALAVGGHHGSFFPGVDRTELQLQQGYVPKVTHGLLDYLAHMWGITESPIFEGPLNPFLGWLAGFVSVVDWLGSHEKMTVWQDEPTDLYAYRRQQTVTVEKLLDDIGWESPKASQARSVRDLIPSSSTPNALQRVAQKVADSGFEFAIVEAPTGEGKTEAAFGLVEALRSAGGGVYFALPTMATANGLFERVSSYLQSGSIGGGNVRTRLLHSMEWLYRDKFQTVGNPGEEKVDGSECEAEDWFAGAKRGLLTPYGVGTIDQCLVGALQAKHGFIRLFALAGKAVVVDEVHAYDVYMSDLLETLLGWLKALGCKVILLSATLPDERRSALFRAWGFEEDGGKASYPAISWIDEEGVYRSQNFEVRERAPLKFMLLAKNGATGWEAGAKAIFDLVKAAEGYGALIFNTVREAQAAANWLKSQSLGGIELDLFHARFTARDREKVENRILSIYGKEAAREGKRILVATQVVEQSLDLDFDHMVTALAPLDLLMQRAGRLHRHPRLVSGALRTDGEADARRDPICYVIDPFENADQVFEIEDRIYAHNLLRKTESLMRSGLTIRRATEIGEVINSVYDETAVLDDRTGWEEQLLKEESRTQEIYERKRRRANEVKIPRVNGEKLLTDCANGLDEDDQVAGSQAAARTRLEEIPSVSLVIFGEEEPLPGRFFSLRAKKDLALRIVKLSAFGEQFRELLDLPTPPNWEKAGSARYAFPMKFNGTTFETAFYQYTYDSWFGLRSERKLA